MKQTAVLALTCPSSVRELRLRGCSAMFVTWLLTELRGLQRATRAIVNLTVSSVRARIPLALASRYSTDGLEICCLFGGPRPVGVKWNFAESATVEGPRVLPVTGDRVGFHG